MQQRLRPHDFFFALDELSVTELTEAWCYWRDGGNVDSRGIIRDRDVERISASNHVR